MDNYQPRGLALDIFNSRYAIHENETWEEACERVANHVSMAESGEAIPKFKAETSEMLKKNLFMPGGRIWYGSGRARGQLLNCFVIPTEDSREGWGKTVSDMIVISGTGGGVGLSGSPIRPRGTKILGTGGQATGAVSLMEINNASGEVIKAGGGRRTALMFALGLSHGDLLEFLDKKLNLDELNNANVSILLDEDPELFFEQVKNDEQFEFKFRGKIIGTIPAKELWYKIIDNSLKTGEPGLLNKHLANKMSNVWYWNELICTNPCITGDTLIATADGRNAVSIKELTEDGKDVPVYSVNPKTGHTEIKMGINPRITGKKKEVWKLTLDDGSIIRATPNHKFYTKDLQEVELKDLKPGDSLKISTKWKTNWKEIFRDKCNSNSQDYWAISGYGGKKLTMEHKAIAEFSYRDVNPGEVVHHKDFCGLNNAADNLEIMAKEDHDHYHSKEMMGEQNPYHKMTDEWKHNFASHPGEENPRYINITNDELIAHGIKLFNRDKIITNKNWYNYASENNLPVFLSNEFRFGKFSNFVDEVYKMSNIDNSFDKECKWCKTVFTVSWNSREQMYCNKECSYLYKTRVINKENSINKIESRRKKKREKLLNTYSNLKFDLGREPKKIEFDKFCKETDVVSRFTKEIFQNYTELKEIANDHNHKVVSIEFDCYEDVYNMTVEDNHNFAIVLPNEATTKSGKTKQQFVFTPQCGEIFMAAYECCCLGSIVLPRFVSDRGMEWALLKDTVKKAVRFLDNVLTVNNYPLPEIEDVCKKVRRIGLGVMGLHDMLLMSNLKYNSPEGLEFVDKVMKNIKLYAYEASCELAEEKGSFPVFDADKVSKSAFVKTLKPTLRKRIKEQGLRNCALLTIPPTGTTSMVCEVTSGPEPMFAPAYERTFWKGDERKTEVVVHPLFKKYVDEGKDVSHFQGAYELSMRDHFEMQRTCQKHIDNAVSKTINVMPGTSREELSDLFMEYLPELKGVTVYPEGSRENQPLTPISLEEALKHIDEAKLEATAEDSCKSGVCDI